MSAGANKSRSANRVGGAARSMLATVIGGPSRLRPQRPTHGQLYRCAAPGGGRVPRLHAGLRRHGRHEEALRLATPRPARPHRPWGGPAGDDMPMPRGYDQPLYLLPFDHRGTFETKMFGWKEPLTSAQTAEIAAVKGVIYDGVKAA